MYALVENNEIIQIDESLPSSWRNISGLNLLSDINKLKQLGWYVVDVQNISYDEETQKISGYNNIYDAINDKVIRTPIIIDITSEEILQELQKKRQKMVCTNYQARVILTQMNLYSIVENIMSAPQTDPLAKIAWEYASNFYRISPFVNSIASVLNLTDEQLDALFEQAMEISV